jgi:hypothetical protein
MSRRLIDTHCAALGAALGVGGLYLAPMFGGDTLVGW